MSAAAMLESGRARRTETVEEAILSRRSVRAFLPEPVPRPVLERLLEMAARSGSNSNVQPWYVYVLTGRAKNQLTRAILAAYDTEGRVATREYPYQPAPGAWAEPFAGRRRAFGDALYRKMLGLTGDDMEGRERHHRRNYDFFGAPVGIILTVSRHPLQGALIDAGLFLQSLMLAARAAGLDTCAQASFIDFHPVLRQELSIPEDEMVVCGLALGYADPRHRLDSLRTTREPLASFATFCEDPSSDS